MILIFIIVDAACEEWLDKSLMKNNHWFAIRVLDLILSISVWLQSIKMQDILDAKDEIHLNKGYAEGRLTSPFIEMRKK